MESARDVLNVFSEWTSLMVSLMAVVVALAGSLQAFIGGVRLAMTPGLVASRDARTVWLRYARWLVAALTFQLCSDIVETAIAPNREDILRLAAIAAIRTFLNYFLEKDLRELRESPQLAHE